MPKSSIATLALCLGIATAAPVLAQTSRAAPPIRIGSFFSVTGQGAFLGEPSQKTLELVTAEINKAGGVDGRAIELVLYDSKTSAKDAAAFARRLIDQDKVDIIIAGNSTGEIMAAVPFIEQSAVPLIAIAGASLITNPTRRWVFRTPHTDAMSVEKVFRRVKQDGGSKVAVLSGAGGYDQSCRKNATQLAPTLGIKLVADEQHATGDADLTTQLTNIRSAGADAILYCGFGAPSSIVARNYKQLGLTPRLYMTVGVASRAYIDGSGAAAEGSRVTGSALLAFKDLPAADPIYEVTKGFVEAYRSAYKEDPSTFAGYAYDAFLIAVEAIRKTGSTDKAKVRDAIESLRGLPGTNGVYSFSADDHQGFSAESLRILEVKSGEYRLVQ